LVCGGGGGGRVGGRQANNMLFFYITKAKITITPIQRQNSYVFNIKKKHNQFT